MLSMHAWREKSLSLSISTSREMVCFVVSPDPEIPVAGSPAEPGLYSLPRCRDALSCVSTKSGSAALPVLCSGSRVFVKGEDTRVQSFLTIIRPHAG